MISEVIKNLLLDPVSSLGILVFYILLFSLPLFAKDINMSCYWDYGDLYFKYEENFLKDKAFRRVDGKWVNVCNSLMNISDNS